MTEKHPSFPWDDTADPSMAENPDSNGDPDIFRRPGMEFARMNILDWRQNGFESRLKMIEDFLEIQDSAECNNCLSNRITEAMNATTEALNGNIDLACKELERKMINWSKCLEERLEHEVKRLKFNEPKEEPRERMIETRNIEHQVVLTNQDIIELAYAHSELIEPLIEHHTKLFFEQANCFVSLYYLIRDLFKVVEPEYLEQHAKVVSFYNSHLSGDFDRLYRVEPKNE